VTTLTGTLRWWKDEKGYGRGLKQGQRVQFEWEGATGGPMDGRPHPTCAPSMISPPR
jgi:cold shock CspA family protein